MRDAVEIPALEALSALLRGRRVVVLSGAGMSTESGIPDYRGPGTRRRATQPIQYRQFTSDPAARQRYWARSLLGWTRVASAMPNAGHRALAWLEQAGCLRGIITQNVDGLHQAAGSTHVVELHGTLNEVVCLGCGAIGSRRALQRRLHTLNPDWSAERIRLAPDGDAELPDGAASRFRVPGCLRCGGAFKPDVVFFGESVPKERVESAWQLFEEAEVLLVVGSSLAVYSGYRFVLRAAKEQRPIAIINLGPTRGDAHAAVRLEERLGAALPLLARHLTGAA